MTKEEVTEEIQAIKNNNVLLELPTSFGKSKQALDIMTRKNPDTVLIVVPRLVLINSWKDEFIKWKLSDWLGRVTFSTYVGLRKFENAKFDMVIFDECHHLTDRALGYVDSMTIKYSTLLSATVAKLRDYLKIYFDNLYCYRVTAKEAIDNSILPDPKVYLIGYKLDNTVRSELFEIKSSKKGKRVVCNIEDKWKYLKDKSYGTVILRVTQQQYIMELNSKIEYWKNMYFRKKNDSFKNKWLQLAGVRLKVLSTFKNPIVKQLLVKLNKNRVLTFCNSIEQTKALGDNYINTENKDSDLVLSKFNQKKVNHITSCNMLNEGVNLVDCQVGIYASVNSSDILIKQKLGRILRHPDPVLIIPYYKGTREEEIVGKMLEDYNPELITEVDNLNQIVI